MATTPAQQSWTPFNLELHAIAIILKTFESLLLHQTINIFTDNAVCVQLNTLTARDVYRRPSVGMPHTVGTSLDVPHTLKRSDNSALHSSVIVSIFSVWRLPAILWCPLVNDNLTVSELCTQMVS